MRGKVKKGDRKRRIEEGCVGKGRLLEQKGLSVRGMEQEDALTEERVRENW